MPKKKKLITISFGVTGSESSGKRVLDGTTVGEIRAKNNLLNLPIYVNGERVDDSHKLKSGDSVVVAAPTKGGM